MILARSGYGLRLQPANPAFAAVTAFRASSRVPFWNCPRTSVRSAGEVSSNVPPFDHTAFPSMWIGCFRPNSARTFATAASYAAWNSSCRPASTAVCHVLSFRNTNARAHALERTWGLRIWRQRFPPEGIAPSRPPNAPKRDVASHTPYGEEPLEGGADRLASCPRPRMRVSTRPSEPPKRDRSQETGGRTRPESPIPHWMYESEDPE